MTKNTVTMEKLASRSFLVYLLLLVFIGIKGQQSQCEDRWFGHKCQYQCHCLNNAVCDRTTGECPGGCDRRWFGPQCQYWDAAYSTNRAALTDGDDSTCLSPYGGLSQVFSMSANVMFTWMRLVIKIHPYVRSLYIFDHVNITFLSSSGTVVAQKSQMTKIYLSDTIGEMYGELQNRINKIRLDFDSKETKQSFCSMQVSSGRNVAIKQTVSQSSINENYAAHTAEKAVDGNTIQSFTGGICSLTNYEDSSNWTLNLSLPVTVNMYTLLSTNEDWGICKLRYFRLESYFESNKVQQYDETATANRTSYDVYSVNASPITSVTLTVSRDRWPNNSYNCDNGKSSLTFCEMQIYGDVMCTQGKWGRDCEKACNCQDPSDSCYISTGMCPSGCKAGFHGPGCLEECDATFYGQGCATHCSDMCVNNACHHITGVCNDCPDGKQISMNCSEDCAPGFFGPRCANQCSEHCGGDGFCNNINGNCLQDCKPGYISENCEQICINNTYGDGCKKTCSVNCVVNTTQEPAICGHVTGQCLLGCKSGYLGITCEDIPSDKVNLVSIVVPIFMVLIVVAGLIIGILFWRRRKAQQDGKEAVAEDGTISGSKGAQGHGDHRELWNLPSNRQDPVNDNYDQISLHSNENSPDSNENKNMRTYKNTENAANNEYDQTSPYVNVDNLSMHEYEEMRSMNEENPDVNVYDKISPYTNVDNSPVNKFDDVGANIREVKTDANISETEAHVYSEPEPGF